MAESRTGAATFPAEFWDKPFTLTPKGLRCGAENLLAVRIHDSAQMGDRLSTSPFPKCPLEQFRTEHAFTRVSAPSWGAFGSHPWR